MPNRLYRDYIKVDSNFIPVFSSSSDRIYPDKWQSFYPHESFKAILTQVVETLEKSSESKNRSLWMSGAYGTGKTYASFTIKHILEDDLDYIKPYFDTNNMQALYTRLAGVRSKGNILVVHRSASSEINSQNKLFSAIMESVKETIKERGYSYTGTRSLLDKVLETLKDPYSAFNFKAAFEKYRARFSEYSTPEAVIRDLETLDMEEKLSLLDDIVNVAEEESYNWSVSAKEIIDWLEDVRKVNNFHAIIFIWDEFTEYFRNNQNKITGLQEIAMASSRIGFYFFLITHSDANQLVTDSGARKVLEARFKQNQIKMGESTAFVLMGQALRKEPDLLSEWNYKVESNLWDPVRSGAVRIIREKDVSVSDEAMKRLLPMHPYSAYLLKTIAQDVSSNQRTMFQFLSGDYDNGDEVQTNFNWFINSFGFEFNGWNYLTVDYLWDYFFSVNNPDLDDTFMSAMTHYNTFGGICENDEQRKVLKAMLLLDALQVKNGSGSRSGATQLFKPTLKNISACFAGTPCGVNVKQILDFFVRKGILDKIDDNLGRDVLYVTTSASVDQDRMDSLMEETKCQITFEKIITDSSIGIADKFASKNFLKYRIVTYNISPVNFRSVLDRAAFESNRIPLFNLFVRNESEQSKVTDVVKYIYNRTGEKCIIVDFSELPLSENKFESYLTYKTKEKYFEAIPNQGNQKKLANQAAGRLLEEWTNRLASTPLRVYNGVDKYETVTGNINLQKKLKEYNSIFYGHGLEEMSENDKLFAESGFRESVAQIAMGKASIPNNYSYLRSLISSLTKDKVWNVPDYEKENPGASLSKMKIAAESVIQKGFELRNMFSVKDVWEELKKPPFGLMPSTGSLFLMGYLLKDYADSKYYKRDINSNTVPLNYTDLSDLILTTIKETAKNSAKIQGIFIVKQKPEHEVFCQKTGEIFKIQKDKRNSIEDIVKNINIYLKNNNYPLWTLKEFINEELYDEPLCDLLVQLTDLLCEIINPVSDKSKDKTVIAEEIYKLYRTCPGIENKYDEILNGENMRSGMDIYIACYNPDFISYAGSLGLPRNEYLSRLNSKMSPDSSYLWSNADIDRQIDNLTEEFKLINAVNSVLSNKQNSLPEIRKALIEKLNIIKLTKDIVIDFYPQLSEIIAAFDSVKDTNYSNMAELTMTITEYSSEFVKFFNDQYSAFSSAVCSLIDSDIKSDEIDYLYNNVDSGIYFKKKDDFILKTKGKLSAFRSNQNKSKLFSLWSKATGSKSPKDWSQEYGIPILCLFEGDEDILFIQKVFDALNSYSSVSDELMDKTVEFLSGEKLEILSNTAECEHKFMELFCQEYSYVIKNADELRKAITGSVGGNVYDWYFKRSSCRAQIQQLAADSYKRNYRELVKEKVRRMTAEEAQKYLEKLIDEDTMLGISILKG